MGPMCIHILRLMLLKRLGTLMAAKPCPGALPAAWMDVRKVSRCASQARSVSYVYVRATDRPCGALRDAGPSADSTSSYALASVTPACQHALVCGVRALTVSHMYGHEPDARLKQGCNACTDSCAFYPPPTRFLFRSIHTCA